MSGVRVWQYALDPDLFRGYNPFCAVNLLHDRLFIEYDKTDMTPYLNRRGCVFCDGRPLKQVALYNQLADETDTYWVEHNGQRVHFRLAGDDSPSNHLIEVTVREQCFAPVTPFLSYIRLRGLTCEHAANGAPVPQRGAISAYRGHHWIIIECTRDGVNLIDNNIIWNVEGRFDPAKVPVEPGSSGWYKLREDESVNGYAVYGEGTDRLVIVHNLIGKCRHSGYYAKPVGFRMGGMDRGGTSRRARIINNIFYDCGEAAIVFPTSDNAAEGNLYVRMTGGYPRVMYPQPEVCLNLPAWREFCGFDLHGQNGWFDIALDEAAGTVSTGLSADAPFGLPAQLKRLALVYNLSDVCAVPGEACVTTDMLGRDRGEASLPGPFAEWSGSISLKETLPCLE